MSQLNIETLFSTPDIKRFHFPGVILWGNDCRNRAFDLLEGHRRIALFVDTFFAESDFITELKMRCAERLVLAEVVDSMPKNQAVDAAVERLDTAPDLVIALGGGSSMDYAKAVIARFIYGTYDGVGMGEKRGMPVKADVAKPLLVTLPTTAGTGADASRYYVTYDSITHGKIHGKSWRLIADWILLDPSFMRDTPRALLVNSAFDAFIHLFESFVCNGERSWFGDMLSVDNMARIIEALDTLVYREQADDEALLALLYASTIGGLAISNQRTGSIHEAAGALLELTELTHPETLMVFFRTAIEQYQAQIADREALMESRFKALGIDGLEGMMSWWERMFEHCAITPRIREQVSGGIKAEPEAARAHIFKRVNDDRVWIEKESPNPLDQAMVRQLIDDSLTRFGYPY